MARRVFILLLSLLTFLVTRADEETFRVLGPAQGLKGRNVLQMTQLPDGRMAVVTDSHVCFYDGKKFQCVQRDKGFVFPLRGYKGYTHIYIDHDNSFWLKDWQTVACLNLNTLRWEKLRWDAGKNPDDLFADSNGLLWFVNGGNILNENGVRLQRRDTAMIQDVDVAGTTVFVFTNDGKVSLYNSGNGKFTGSYAAYGKDEEAKYKNTSLVVNANDGNFYQIRTGGKSVLLSFNRKTRAWQSLLDVDYTLHTLIVSSDSVSSSKLYVSCERGYWVIDLKTGEQHLLTVLHLPDGSAISTGYNTICRDRDGGIWLGSYDKGLLYASPEAGIFDEKDSGGLPWIALTLTVVAIIMGAGLWWRRHRRGKDSEALPDKTLQPDSERQPFLEERQSSLEERQLSEEDAAFLKNATELVVKNIRNTEYSVVQLASDLYMERTGLYKKMMTITGQSPVAFIRSIRLERAAEMLKAGGHTITEISELTGFSSPGYFTKCFQKQFGRLPSEY